jgi:hypothetical protein
LKLLVISAQKLVLRLGSRHSSKPMLCAASPVHRRCLEQ